MRVVLDTNTLVSALLFRGTASRLTSLWQSGRVTPLISGPILEECLRVLSYPKFRLTDQEIRGLVGGEVLPFVETVKPTCGLLAPCRDAADAKFLECAVAGRARYLVTGDQDLRVLGTDRRISILTVGEFLEVIRP